MPTDTGRCKNCGELLQQHVNGYDCCRNGPTLYELVKATVPSPAHRQDSLREQVAALSHEQWSGWMRYLFSRCAGSIVGGMHIPGVWVERWHRQMETPYESLSEAEKDSDRKEADRVLALLDSEADRLNHPPECPVLDPVAPGQAPCPRCGAPAETHTDGVPTLYCRACGYADDRRVSREGLIARLQRAAACEDDTIPYDDDSEPPQITWDELREYGALMHEAADEIAQSARGEAGLRALVTKWREDANTAIADKARGHTLSFGLGKQHALTACADALDAALASHPPEEGTDRG